MKKMIASFVAIGMTIALLGCSPTSDGGHDHDHEGHGQDNHAHASATPKAAQTVSITPHSGPESRSLGRGHRI